MSSSDQLAKYFQEAASFSACLNFNRSDFEFAETGGRIVYIVDANIVRFFATPQTERSHVIPFRNDRTVEYGDATALITAEFLFSRALAGQNGAPTYITPAHGEELQDIIDAVAAEARAHHPDTLQYDTEPLLIKERKAQLEGLLKKIRLNEVNREDAAKGLQVLVPDLAKLLLSDGFQAPAQIVRLYNDDLLRPLAVLPDATSGVLRPDSDFVKSWVRRLAKLRPPQSPRESLRLTNDAESLIQVMMLDEEAMRSGENKRYVLVTADRALFSAYIRWFWSNERSEEQRFVLRMPLQYTPVLNAYEMPNEINDIDLSVRASHALESLFGRLKSVDSSYTERLLWYGDLATSPDRRKVLKEFYGSDPVEFDDALELEFKSVRKLWDKCFRNSVLLNTRLMNRRNADFSLLSTLLSVDGDLRKHIYDYQAQTLQYIEHAHTAFSAKANINQIIRDEDGILFTPGSARAELLVRAKFPSIFGDKPIAEALRQLDGNPSVIKALNEVVNRGDSQSYFLAACIAYQCGQWWLASVHATRALQLLPSEAGPDDISGEITFLYASASRYALATGNLGDEYKLMELEPALEALRGARDVCLNLGDNIGAARALCEITSIKLFRLYYRWLSDLSVPDSELVDLKTFTDELNKAGTLLSDGSRVQEGAPFTLLLKRRVARNLVSAAAYAIRLAPGTDAAELLRATEEATRAALERVSKDAPTSASGLVMAAESLIVQSALDVDASIDSLQSRLQEIVDRARDIPGLLRMDEAEIERLARILADTIASRSGIAMAS